TAEPAPGPAPLAERTVSPSSPGSAALASAVALVPPPGRGTAVTTRPAAPAVAPSAGTPSTVPATAPAAAPALATLAQATSKPSPGLNPRQMFYRGYAYYLGRGVARDVRQAVSWWRKAADAGDPRAQAMLGRMYHAGEGG